MSLLDAWQVVTHNNFGVNRFWGSVGWLVGFVFDASKHILVVSACVKPGLGW